MQLAPDAFVRVLVAAGLAAVLGLEREYHRKPAGLRTNILIGIGSALFMILSLGFAHENTGSADRLAAQIVSGIGFLGAGAIMRGGHSVHGLTTAATIWVNAAIGMTAGAAAYGIATGITFLTLFILIALEPLEQFFDRWAHRRARADSRSH